MECAYPDSLLAESSPARDQSLDLGSLELFVFHLFPHNVLFDVVPLLQLVERADFGGALGPEAAGSLLVGDVLDRVLAVLDDGKGQNTEVLADDAAADALALALALPSRTVALVSLGHEQPDAATLEEALAHAEAVLVVAASDLEDVSNELWAQDVARELVAHPLVKERTTTL